MPTKMKLDCSPRNVAVFVKQALAKISAGFARYEYTRKFLLLGFAFAVTLLSFIYTIYNKLSSTYNSAVSTHWQLPSELELFAGVKHMEWQE